jgi:tetratricopeptide (TPR) repeat protein
MGQYENAHRHYNQALRIARIISEERAVLIEALLGGGHWAARRNDVETARGDLEEAMVYALQSGYRLYEADIHVGLAWTNFAAGNLMRAREEAEQARHMSTQMEYHWGQVDAAEVSTAINRAVAQ